MDSITILAGLVISAIVPLIAAVFIKPSYSTEVKGIISSTVGGILALGLSLLQAYYNHAFDEGKDTLTVVIGIIIASHVFYEMFEKSYAQWIQLHVGIK